MNQDDMPDSCDMLQHLQKIFFIIILWFHFIILHRFIQIEITIMPINGSNFIYSITGKFLPLQIIALYYEMCDLPILIIEKINNTSYSAVCCMYTCTHDFFMTS